MRIVEISFHSPHPRPLPKGARELLFPRRCLEAALGDMAANLKNWTTGGELLGYSDMLEQTGNLVLQRLAEQAHAVGADAVVGMRLVTSNMAEGAAELIGYGTAVRVVD